MSAIRFSCRCARRVAAIPLALALLGTAGASSFAAQPAAGSTAAVVNGHSLPMSEYQLLLGAARRESGGQGSGSTALTHGVVNQLIAYELIREWAAAHGINVAGQVAARVQFDEHAYGGLKGLQKRLAQQGLNLNTYEQLLTFSYREQRVEQRIAPLITGPQPSVRVRHILVSLHPSGKPARTIAAARARANQALAQIQHGGRFARVARQYSDDASTANNGGYLGNIFRNQTTPLIVGQIGPTAFGLALYHPALLYTAYGWDIIDVLARGQSVAPPAIQREAQANAFSAWLAYQTKRASIQRFVS